MCSGNLPDPNNRAYYTCLDDIKNHIGKAKRALQLSVVDLENAGKIIKHQQKLYTDSHFYFRLYKKKKRSGNALPSNMQDLNTSDFESTLLWVHQETW